MGSIVRAMPIAAVLFDLDNTLILEDASTFRALETAARAAAPGVDPKALADAAAKRAATLFEESPVGAFGARFGIWWGEALWGGFAGDAPELRSLREYVPGYRRQVWRDALASLGASDGAVADRLAAAYIDARRARETIDPVAAPVLEALARRYRLALVTNGAPDVQREKLSRTPFAPFFKAIVVSVEVGYGKPDPRLFEHAARALDVTAAECAVVGDSLQRDVAGARAAGMKAVWLDRRLWNEPDAPQPDARIERLSDLPVALDALARQPASPRATL